MNIRSCCAFFAIMVLSMASVWADVVESTGVHFGKFYTNNGVLNPGEAGTIGVSGYNLYVQNLALGKTTAQVSSYSEAYPSGKAVDGISYDTDGAGNFSHTAEAAGTKWWQVNFADTPTAITSVQIANRPGFTGRLNNFTISIYNVDPSSEGATPLWTSAAQPTFGTTTDITLDGTVQGTWLRITNGATDTTPLALVEVAIPTGVTETKAGTYNSQAGWTAPNFKQESGATLQIDAKDGQFDTLDVSGTFMAGGTFDLNVLNSSLTAGEYQVIKAGKYYGAFGTVKVTGITNLETANLILKTDNLNSQGKITLEALAGSMWKSNAADTNFANAANWSNGVSEKLYLGYYDTALGGTATATLSSALDHTTGIVIAQNARSAGVLTIAEGANLTESGNIWVGVNGVGTLNQTGGTVAVNSAVYTADVAGSTSTMSLSGGTFTANHFLIGVRGNATVNVAAGGSLTVTESYNGSSSLGFEIGYENGSVGTLNITGGTVVAPLLQMGHGNGSTGNLNISSGSLTVNASSNNARIGDSGNANFTQTGGTVVFNAPLYISDQATSNSTMNLSGGTFTANGSFVLGTRGPAVMNVSGSADVTIKSELNIGFGAHDYSSGTINQSGGTLTVTNAGGVKIGAAGWTSNVAGAYNLSGGTLVTPQLVLARPDATNVTGKFALLGSGKAVISGTLAVPTTMYGGSLQAGTISGTVDQYAGVLTPGGDGTYGTTTISGNYNLIANTLVTPASGNFALKKATSQVSTYAQSGSTVGFESFNAVDGELSENVGGVYHIAHTTSASGTNQWWQVDLGGIVSLDSIRIYNRLSDGSRLTPFHFELYDGTNDAIGNKIWYSSSLSGLTGRTYTFGDETLGESLYGRTLRIVRDFPNGLPGGDDNTLNLLEVQVTGEVAKPTVHLDMKADGTAGDKLILTDGAIFDVTGGVLEFEFDDVDAIAPGLELNFLELQGNAALQGDWAEIILPELPSVGMFWDLEALKSGTISVGVPEPAAWVLMFLVLGIVPFVQKRKNKE